jgi:hypothetical protein
VSFSETSYTQHTSEQTALSQYLKLTERGAEVTFTGNKALIRLQGQVVAGGTRQGVGLFELDQRSTGLALKTTLSETELSIWHRRFGHINTGYTPENVDGMPKLARPEIDSCNTCSLAKSHKSAMKPRNRKAGVLERLHIDTWGPIRIPSIHKNTYLFSIIDEGSEMRNISGMQSKNEAIQHLKAFVACAETELGRKVKYIRLDGAGEFHSDNITQWARVKGIQLEYTTPYTPE